MPHSGRKWFSGENQSVKNGSWPVMVIRYLISIPFCDFIVQYFGLPPRRDKQVGDEVAEQDADKKDDCEYYDCDYPHS